jgi:hypothetical protein
MIDIVVAGDFTDLHFFPQSIEITNVGIEQNKKLFPAQF